MTAETLDKIEKQIDKIEAAILKYTDAQNNHDMARRAVTPIESRNELAGDVYKSRKDLDLILSTVKADIQAERERLCAIEQTEAQEAIIRVAKLSETIGCLAGVGESELAGQIISCLYAYPELVRELMDGNLDMFEDERMRFQNGALSWQAANGDVVSPSELRAHLGQRDN